MTLSEAVRSLNLNMLLSETPSLIQSLVKNNTNDDCHPCATDSRRPAWAWLCLPKGAGRQGGLPLSVTLMDRSAHRLFRQASRSAAQEAARCLLENADVRFHH